MADRLGAAAGDAEDVGRDEGGRRAVAYLDAPSSLEALVSDLDRLGFDPIVTDGDDDDTAIVAFAHCPFADIAAEHPELVCGLHRGLVAGFVARMGDAEVRRVLHARRPHSLPGRGPFPVTFNRSTQEEAHVITLTDTATVKVKELLEAEGATDLALRVAVRPGGCSGFSYEMFFDGDVAADDEQATFGDAVKVVVDQASAQLLDGATLDYKDGLDQSGFAITNPNATRTCGCGSSFS